MPAVPLIAAAVVGGATVYAANQADDASQHAVDAQTAQADKSTAAQLQMYAQSRQDQTPWRVTGEAALQQLAGLYNINVPTGTYGDLTGGKGAGSGAPVSAYSNVSGAAGGNLGQPIAATPAAPAAVDNAEWDKYLADNPDVASWAASGHGDPNIPIEQQTPEQRAAYQFRNSGQAEGRQVTPTPGFGAAPAATPSATPAPDGSNPNQAPFFASPDYAFRMSEGLRGVDAGGAARGMLDSGATRKAEIQYAGNLASGEFNTYANRLAALAGVGQTSATNTAQIGQNTVNQLTGINTALGNNQASSFNAQGQIAGNTAKTLAGLAGGVITNFAKPATSGVGGFAGSTGGDGF